MKYVAGLDLSLRSAGISLVPTDWAPALDWGRVVVRTVGLELTKDSTEWEHGHRIAAMSKAILEFIQAHDVEHVFLEGYAYSQMLSRAHSLGELGGAVKLRLYDAGIRWTTIVASSARTHLGKMPRKDAKKAVSAALTAMGCPEDWQGDERDAFVIANAGTIRLDHVGISVPREQSKKVKGARAA